MSCPLSSNLIGMISKAIDDCFYCGSGRIKKDDVEVAAEWIDSVRNPGYSIICITVLEKGVVKFSYNDYGTECEE